MVLIVVLITAGGTFARTRGFAVSLAGAGTRPPASFAAISRAPLDLDARGRQRFESVPAAIIDEVLAKLQPLFDPARRCKNSGARSRRA
jgi:hypothetical protein